LSVGVGELFGGVLARLDSQAAFSGGFGRAFKHRFGNIGKSHMVSETGEIQAGVTATRGNIQNLGRVGQGNGGDCALDVFNIFQYMAAPVAMALLCELFPGRFLNLVKFHGPIIAVERLAGNASQ
jgi:hypothetical protein